MIVLVTTSFPIGNDGSESAGSFVADLAEELAKHVEVRVVAPGANAAREQWSRSVEVYRYAAPPRPLSTLKLYKPSDMWWIARTMLGGMRETRAAASGAKQMLALWGLPCGEWARRAARERRIDYCVWLLGSDVWTLGRLPILRDMLGRVIRQAKRAYADGYQLAKDAQRIAGERVAFLPSTRRIELTNPGPPQTQPPYRLLFLGRWHPNKGVDLLLDALADLDDSDWKKIERVEVQGGGPLEPLVRGRIARMREAGRPVVAGGFLTKPEAEAAIVRADWVLIPSRIESIPVIFSDAMKLGRPVIATPVGDLPNLVRKGCGILARAADAPSIANALREAIHSGAADMTAIRSCAGQFRLDRIVSRLHSEAIQNRG